MRCQKKRRVGKDAASEQPRGEPDTRQVLNQIDAAAIRRTLREFPPMAYKASADWHINRARTAGSIPEQRHHLRMWAIRWSCYMLSIGTAWTEYADAVFYSAAVSSSLSVRYRAAPVRKFCRALNRVVWGED